MITNIVVTFTFPFLHRWKDAPKQFKYLSYPHRHLMFVECKKEVSHNNRDIEFIEFKNKLEVYVKTAYPINTVHSLSCEDVAHSLLTEFGLSYCKVMEDNENGAEIWLEEKK